MKFVLFAVLALCAVAFADVEVSFTDCGSSSDIGKVNRITASVFPPKSGSHMSMHQFHDNFKESITGGTYEIVTKLGALTVDTKKGDICTYGSLTCPSATGAVQIDLESDVGSVPSGTYTMKTTGKTASGALIWCHQVTFKM